MKAKIKRWAEASLSTSVLHAASALWRKVYWWRRKRISPRRNRRVTAEILRRGGAIKLELGSGKRPGMEGWIASDIGGGGDIQLDLSQPIPFPDNSVDRIYTSHVLEHFPYPHPMLDLLQECRRILKTGGIFSIAVPNARLFLDAYSNPDFFDKKKYCAYDVGLSYKSEIDYVNFIAYMGGDHRHMFDEKNIVTILEEGGFSNVCLREFDPAVDLPARRHESLYAVGIKE
jgi:predicted SAM-dependent methyltransferase